MDPIKTKVAHDKNGAYQAPDVPERENGAYWIRWKDDDVEVWAAATYRDGSWIFPGKAGSYDRVTVEADYVKADYVQEIVGPIPEPAP